MKYDEIGIPKVLFYEWKVTNTRFILRRESASPIRPCFYGLYNCFSIAIIWKKSRPASIRYVFGAIHAPARFMGKFGL